MRPRDEIAKHVEQGRRTAFAGVADAVGSGHLTGEVELGAVWAALPHLMPPIPQMPGLDPAWRRPLFAYPSVNAPFDESHDPLMDGRPLELVLGDVAADWSGLDRDALETVAVDIEANYPTSTGIAIPSWHGVRLDWAPTGQLLPVFLWPRIQHPVKIERLEALAPTFRHADERMLLPQIAGRDFLSPLMLWWVLLFGLSMIARYDPEVWISALDVNESLQAVPLEAALEMALDVLPGLILGALVADLPSGMVSGSANCCGQAGKSAGDRQ